VPAAPVVAVFNPRPNLANCPCFCGPDTAESRVDVIAAGGAHSLALKSDGTVIAWGDNPYGQSTVPSGLSGVTGLLRRVSGPTP
jgi:alpha-tubulin suppressor-like RCC1 family protein